MPDCIGKTRIDSSRACISTGVTGRGEFPDIPQPLNKQHTDQERSAVGRRRLLLNSIGDGSSNRLPMLRPGSRCSRVPAIAITAYARPEDPQRSLLAGYHMHLPQPLEPAELVASIANLLT